MNMRGKYNLKKIECRKIGNTRINLLYTFGNKKLLFCMEIFLFFNKSIMSLYNNCILTKNIIYYWL